MANKARPTAGKPLVAFSWGYEGWGNHTKELVEVVDAIEASRGYRRPIFVDVRIRRQVRAVGFRERAFEDRLGPKRYSWLRGLGNRAIVEELDEDVVIDDPAQADALLDKISSAAAEGCRVIFFCSCGSPQHAADCHRSEVARLVLRAARRRDVALAVHEWPGGSPISTDIEIDINQLKKLLGNGLARLPLPAAIDIVRAAALPHLSLIYGGMGDMRLVVISGPAARSARGWTLPVYNVGRPSEVPQFLRTLNEDLREMNLAPRGAKLNLPRRWRHESLTEDTEEGR